ncbi:PKD domain-containing protein [Lewinella sp. JB7]|uniref:PKD domain-containing protein n=1 Tax=Lewinella sp. JB7 TaxID=2962887 RepID=UPI00273A6D11|nr:PKD domain-containing protein [Lewinella sp. JB7]
MLIILRTTRARFYLTALTWIFLSTCVPAQNLPNCDARDCGDLHLEFDTVDEIFACWGEAVTLVNQSEAGFDFFVVDWRDGTTDTVRHAGPISHVYEVPDDDYCSPAITYRVALRGVKNCGSGTTCVTTNVAIEVVPDPTADFSAREEACVGEEVIFLEESCNESNDGYYWDFGDGTTSTLPNPGHAFDRPGTYDVRLRVSARGGCGERTDEIVRQVRVVAPPDPAFDISEEDLTVCMGETITFTNRANDHTKIRWTISSPDEWEFTDPDMDPTTDVIGVRFTGVGDYRVRLTGENACGSEIAETSVRVRSSPIAELHAPEPSCGALSVSPDDFGFWLGGEYDGVCWVFDQAGRTDTICAEDFGSYTFESSGTAEVLIASSCGTQSWSVDVTVNVPESLHLSAEATYCSGTAPTELGTSIAGGSWSGPGIVDAGTGRFDPGSARVGENVITYTVDRDHCTYSAQITVRVVASEQVTTPDATYCADDSPQTLSASPGGGSWSGAGITDAAAGTFDPRLAGAGTHTPVYTYSDGSGCRVVGRPTITVTAPPNFTVPDTVIICFADADFDLSEVAGLSEHSTAGTFRWTTDGRNISGGKYNPRRESGRPGFVSLRMRYTRAACSVERDVVLHVTEPVAVTIAPVDEVCIDAATHQLTGSPTGGQWSGPGIDAVSGVIDLWATGGGVFIYRYTLDAGKNCERSTTREVTVSNPGRELHAGPAQQICEGEALTVLLEGAEPADGTWSGPGLEGNTVRLASLVPDSTYEYTYTRTTERGCSASVTKLLTYDGRPHASFGTPDSLCAETDFRPAGEDPGATYHWDFGDGTTSDEVTPQHAYSAGGRSYVQQLSVTSAAGCRVDTQRSVYVTALPTADFTLDSVIGCAPFQLDLQGQLTGEDIRTAWFIGRDTIGTFPSVQHTLGGFVKDTTLTVTLVAENGCGAGTREQSVTVKPTPRASFAMALDHGCSPFAPRLNNRSVGQPTGYQWVFGNGETSEAEHPEVPAFTTEMDTFRTYRISLTATNACGRNTFSDEVTVHPPDVRALISLDETRGCQPWTFSPRSGSTPGAALAWSVLDSLGREVATGRGSEPLITLREAGHHRIVLRASRCGTATDTAHVWVTPTPALAIEVPQSICEEEELTLETHGGTFVNAQWRVGGIITSDERSPTVHFSRPGRHVISLAAEAPLTGCPVQASATIDVLPQPLARPAAVDSSSCPPFTTTFTPGADDNDQLTFQWKFDDGGNVSDRKSPTYTYERSGNYEPSVTVTDTSGCSTTAVLSRIRVHAVPAADFTVPATEFCGPTARVPFTTGAPDAAAYAWTFGDGNRSTEARPAHVYSAPGTYPVELVTRSAHGCGDTSSTIISVLAAPEADFDLPPPVVCAPFDFSFRAKDTEASRYEWFLDGEDTPFVGRRFEVELTEARSYDLRLVAINRDMCRDTLTVPDVVQVESTPTADFFPFVDEDPVRVGEVRFDNRSTGADAYRWEFGDSTASTELSPLHVFRRGGTYDVKLTATAHHAGGFTCADSLARLVRTESFGRFFVPTALSPESGSEEVRQWGAKGMQISAYTLEVFSPFGQRVFVTDALDEGRPAGRWDGTYAGSDEVVPQGAYTWRAQVTYHDGRTENLLGTVTVIR